jgi:hypothetical protein
MPLPHTLVMLLTPVQLLYIHCPEPSRIAAGVRFWLDKKYNSPISWVFNIQDSFMSFLTTRTSCMELDLPNPDASIRARTGQLPDLFTAFYPQNRIDTPHTRILDRNVETDVLDTPNVHVRVE